MITPFLLLILSAASGLLSYRLYRRQEDPAARQWPGLLAGVFALIFLIAAVATL